MSCSRSSLPSIPSPREPQRDNGALVEFLRTYPGSMVNPHVARFVVWGKHAGHLISSQPWNYAFGHDSALDRFVQLDGRILLLGCDHDTVTFLHYAEHIVDIPEQASGEVQGACCRAWQARLARDGGVRHVRPRGPPELAGPFFRPSRGHLSGANEQRRRARWGCAVFSVGLSRTSRVRLECHAGCCRRSSSGRPASRRVERTPVARVRPAFIRNSDPTTQGHQGKTNRLYLCVLSVLLCRFSAAKTLFRELTTSPAARAGTDGPGESTPAVERGAERLHSGQHDAGVEGVVGVDLRFEVILRTLKTASAGRRADSADRATSCRAGSAARSPTTGSASRRSGSGTMRAVDRPVRRGATDPRRQSSVSTVALRASPG